MTFPDVSPLLSLRSAYHRVWYELSEAIRWSRGNYQEVPAGTLPLLSPRQRRRIDRLKRRYYVQFEQHVQARIALANYEYLDMLDRARQVFLWAPTARQDIVDVGSQNFYYAAALDAVFHPRTLLGIELEGYRVYSDGYSRYDYAQYYTSFVPHAEYLPMDFCRFRGQADGITCFFPFVTAEASVAWRLPLKVFQPRSVFENMVACLRPGGMVFMVNHGEKEAVIASKLAQQQGLTRLGQSPYTDPLCDRPLSSILSLWKKPA